MVALAGTDSLCWTNARRSTAGNPTAGSLVVMAHGNVSGSPKTEQADSWEVVWFRLDRYVSLLEGEDEMASQDDAHTARAAAEATTVAAEVEEIEGLFGPLLERPEEPCAFVIFGA